MKPSAPQMLLDPADLDESVAQSVRQTMYALLNNGELPPHLAQKPNGKSEWRAARKQLQEAVKMPKAARSAFEAATNTILFSLLWFVLALCYDLHLARTGANGGGGYCLFSLPFFIAGCGVMNWFGKEAAQRKRQQALLAGTFFLLLPLLERENKIQAAYCEAVAALLREPSAWGGEMTVKNILHDLRDLFQTGKQTTAQRVRMQQAMSQQTPADMEAEAARLVQRIQTARDAAARKTWEQSLALLEARQTRIAATEPLRERLEAQEEAILQALREAQAALSDTHFAGGWMETHAGGANAETAQTPWSEAAQRLRQQTEAVEQAVREVMAVQTVGGGR